jgi:hypothetical protein
VTRIQVLPGLDASDYRRHMLHDDSRLWVEKNCYVDVCIELLHALGLDPLAAMGACAGMDFEGDNFTFFKPSHEELRALYGVDVQELNVWLPLMEHAVNHMSDGKFISTEADAFHLPDTEGTDYHRHHVKTTIILADLDVAARRLGYFHNAGYYTLGGEDFERLFRLDVPDDPTFLPLFAELIRVDRVVHRPRRELAQIASALLVKHIARRPLTNPIPRFQHRVEAELAVLQGRGLAYYHTWAFATVRQLGSAFELFALHLRWLATASEDGDESLTSAAQEFEALSGAAKRFILKAARAVNSRKPLDASAGFTEMAESWERGMSALAMRLALESTEQAA